jgi:C1A family cysteine protease
MTIRKIQRYGWKPDLPDHRDKLFSLKAGAPLVIPQTTDMRPLLPPAYDQSTLGSCTSNAIAGGLEYDQKKNNWTQTWTPSRLMIYFMERQIEGDISTDGGGQIRDGIKAVASTGVCPESVWPYDITQFAVTPNAAAYAEAAKHKLIKYQRVIQSLLMIRMALAAGYPVVFGFTVFESFESEQVAQSGILNLPEPGESMVGGHAVLMCGHDDGKQQFLVRNSWGPDWGQEGYFWMPYNYANNPNLASDFWTVETLS